MIQYSHLAVLYDVDQNRNCYFCPLHLITDFHISIVPSILFHRFPSQKDFFLYKVRRIVASLLRSTFGREMGFFSLQNS